MPHAPSNQINCDLSLRNVALTENHIERWWRRRGGGEWGGGGKDDRQLHR